MTDRKALLELRPKIPTIIEEQSISPAERFQNLTLRPILKMQNELLLEIFKQYIEKRKGVFYQLTSEKRLAYIQSSLQQDMKFKNLLIGTIIGQFTITEWQYFQKSEKELIRRMTTLLIQRLQDQVDQLKILT